jgi:hypothetical protein
MLKEHPRLQEKEYYINRYDHATVEECRWAEKAITTQDVKKYSNEKIDEVEILRLSRVFNELHLWFLIGERYARKEEIISGWMQKDRDKDHLYETAQAPTHILCLTCSREMVLSSKHLETRLDASDRVLFMYDCTLGHLPRRAFYNTGEEWDYKPPLCRKCNAPLDQEDHDSEEKLKWTLLCPKCGHTETHEIDRTKKEDELDPDFEKDRARFCSEKEGREYVEWMNTAKELTAILDKQKEKEKEKDVYDAVAKIKKLTIVQLENVLRDPIEVVGYVKFDLGKPTIEKDVTIDFSAQDAKSDRKEYDSVHELQGLIKRHLEPTNWRLMSDGVSYRLGFLSGRLRAYEKEEDLVKLVKFKLKKSTHEPGHTDQSV